MADTATKSKIDAATEKALEEAAAGKASAAKVAEAVKADAPKPEVSADAVKKAVKAPAKKKPAAKKAVAKKTAAKPAAKKAPAKKVAVKKAPIKKAAARKSADVKSNPVLKLKDTIMATATKTDFTATAKEMAADVQTRMKGAYTSAAEFAGDFGEFNKANLDAVVESGKIFFSGAQELARENVETGKTVVETVTADAKKMVAVKSPTELFQLQGELARRNFDAIVGYGSKRTEAWVKLYNDAFAPISNRVSVAAEKISKAA